MLTVTGCHRLDTIGRMPSDQQERALWSPPVYNLHVVDGHPHVHEAANSILPNLICTYCRIRYFVIGPCNAKKTGWVPNVDTIGMQRSARRSIAVTACILLLSCFLYPSCILLYTLYTLYTPVSSVYSISPVLP